MEKIKIDGKEYTRVGNAWYDLERYVSVPPDVLEKIHRLLEEREKGQEEERRRQQEQEAEARRLFERRKERYQVAWYSELDPLSPLNRIFMEIDDGKRLTKEDIDWLKARRIFQVLALYYERIDWLASAGSYWRKAGNPRRALEITKGSPPKSPILTMRGGAFRDIDDLNNAQACGERAVECAPKDYHPYNLLGAIFYQSGEPEKGDKYFEKARELGSQLRYEESSIRSAVKKAGPEEKRRVAEYLLKKDPKRFQWVQKHIEPAE